MSQPKTEDPKTTETTEAPEKSETTEEQPPKTFSQSDLDAVAAKVRKEAKEAALKEAREAAEAERAAAEKAQRDATLKEQQKFEELAETRAAEVAELTNRNTALAAERDDVQAQLERANAALATHLATLEKGLTIPDGVKELLEGKSVVDRLEWLSKNAETFKSPVNDDGGKPKPNETKPPVRGVPPTPEPRKTVAPSADEKAKRAASPRNYL